MDVLSIIELVPQAGISLIVVALLIWLQNRASVRIDRLEDRIQRKDDQVLKVVGDYKDVSHELSATLEKNVTALENNTKMTERVYDLLTKTLQ
jgi:DNA-binding transcriptional regulator GbsR (MarR family)